MREGENRFFLTRHEPKWVSWKWEIGFVLSVFWEEIMSLMPVKNGP